MCLFLIPIYAEELQYQHNGQNNSLFQHQLSTLRQESDSRAKEIEVHKQAITEKEEELKHLSHQLKMQEAMIQQKLQQQQVQLLETSKTKQELVVEVQVHSLRNEISELQLKLVQAEEEKQQALRQLEADQMKSRLLGEYMTELTASEAKVRWI